MIEIRNLKKCFGEEKVLNSINIDIQDGDIFGLVGRSGVGKSTLLRCINALETYDSGILNVNGAEVSSLSGMELRKFRRNVGMIFQHFSLTERDTVYQNIALPMKCWKYEKQDIKKKVESLLEIVELGDRSNQKARYLSGGQKQRVAIARALALEPSILLCDEATSALDPNTTKSILELLKEVNRKLGVTIVVVTHEMSVVRSICNKIAVLDKNGIADSGDVEEVFKNQCPALVELLGNRDDFASIKSGKAIRVFCSSDDAEKNIIVKMFRDTKISFGILNADVKEYRTGIFGEFVILVREEDEKNIIEYMSANNIFWEVLN
ncbi:methionine ABC transporter ATP-binding protein [Faecalicatena contorta]|uniref:D-methionine transport system ATP-binding protein n=1 Tax=Faecalicatena contorta TaxID=39482 RepID=A0A316A332_9FIRM|nr:methionine ABC transporter ATP-binding protein [Faecalicatena contorta]PWJ51942.1 D-methionine transport system ATP-binding protein [Faecalicatena contorta]SUQ12220.1 D-methionine transport system ATP-binding protein [Faecalicatena contorta]